MGPEIRHPQVAQQQTAVGMRVGAHAPVARRRKRRKLRDQSSMLVE